MSPERRSRLQSVLRARRERTAAWARLRRDRLAAGYEVAAAQERALLGALILRPRVIRAVARARPPVWFTDNRALTIMRGLFCASGYKKPDLARLIRVLEDHDVLDLLGGPDAIRSLVAPRPALDQALQEVEGLIGLLPPSEQEAIEREERLDDVYDWLASDPEPVAQVAATPAEVVAEDPVVQLELFASCPPVKGKHFHDAT